MCTWLAARDQKSCYSLDQKLGVGLMKDKASKFDKGCFRLQALLSVETFFFCEKLCYGCSLDLYFIVVICFYLHLCWLFIHYSRLRVYYYNIPRWSLNIGARFIALGQLWLDQMPSLNGRAQYFSALILDKQFYSLMHVFNGIHELIPSENGWS